jgi:hypothetical protein
VVAVMVVGATGIASVLPDVVTEPVSVVTGPGDANGTVADGAKGEAPNNVVVSRRAAQKVVSVVGSLSCNQNSSTNKGEYISWYPTQRGTDRSRRGCWRGVANGVTRPRSRQC